MPMGLREKWAEKVPFRLTEVGTKIRLWILVPRDTSHVNFEEKSFSLVEKLNSVSEARKFFLRVQEISISLKLKDLHIWGCDGKIFKGMDQLFFAETSQISVHGVEINIPTPKNNYPVPTELRFCPVE